MNLFNEDNFLHRFFLSAGGFIGLNLLWILTSIPVVTVGASTTALYYCTLKLHKDREISIWKCYWRSFRGNFFQATAVWLCLAAAGVCVWFEKAAVAEMPGAMSVLFTYVVWGIALALLVIALYVFPTIASFENKAGRLAVFALCFAARKPVYALCMAALTCLPMYFTMVDAQLFPIYFFVWIMCGFSLTAYGNSWFLWRLFRPYFEKEERTLSGIENESDQYVF